MKPLWRSHIAGVICGVALPTCLHGQTVPATPRLEELSIEELLNVQVTSVSKQEETIRDAPAAIVVLSNDDIRRSGATTIPDALRLAPGVNVGSANAREAAVSARGFSFVFATKLLVLVDGRAVYTSLFGSVQWDLQQTMLEDVDRIEVIRGPGATVWGANAVNGVINIVTRSARETQGALLYGGGGNVHEALAGGRYGGKIGDNTYYRVFGSHRSEGDHPLADGQSAQDHWLGQNGGFRLDHYRGADTQVTWQADTTAVRYDAGAAGAYNVNTLGRWTRRRSERSSVEVQAYFDRHVRNEPDEVNARSDTFDVDANRTLALGAHQDVIWGAGYRFIAHDIEQRTPIHPVTNGAFGLRLFSAFVQDELRLVPGRLTLTAGLKLEHNDFTGFEPQPSVRAVFKPAARQTVWGAVSRAVRTPAAIEGRDLVAISVGEPFPGPDGGLYRPSLVGNTAITSEVLQAYELGYRIQPARRISVDIATFYNDYRDLITFGETTAFVPGSPVGRFEIAWTNALHGHLYGGETVITISPTDSWRLTASHGLLIQRMYGPASASRILAREPPRHQPVVRSSHEVTKSLGVDVQVRFVDRIEAVPAYLTADFHLSYRPTTRLELSLVGQNLFDGHHPEEAVTPTSVTSEARRGVHAKIDWRF